MVSSFFGISFRDNFAVDAFYAIILGRSAMDSDLKDSMLKNYDLYFYLRLIVWIGELNALPYMRSVTVLGGAI